jgi:cellobiose phosphorylase
MSHRADLSDLRMATHLGGYSPDGSEFVIRLVPGESTPAPWSNVVANPGFGFLVTESGGGYTWAVNSRENKLTSWSNDPVCDTPGEAVYIRDDDSGVFWSPAPLPCRGAAPYEVRHGQGWSRFTHEVNGVSSDLLLSIAPNDRVKFVCLTLRNTSRRPRRLSVAYFAELVLGVRREESWLHVSTAIDPSTGALVARNRYHPDFPGQVVFLHMPGRLVTVTGDRGEFIGRNGRLDRPDAMRYVGLSGTTGAGLDPCAAVETRLNLDPGEMAEVIVLLGQCDDEAELSPLVSRYTQPAAVHQAIEATKAYWDRTLRAVEIATPDARLDVMVNRWLPYQVLSCRVWGRSAFYQSGGAYGFRDQLRTSWHWSTAGRSSPANTCSAAPRTSLRKETCSTGGTNQRGAGCALDSSTICCGFRWRRATTSR